jgi:hypothetical protein
VCWACFNDVAKSDGNWSVLMNRSQPKRHRSRAAHLAYSPNVSTTGDSTTGVMGGVTGAGASWFMRWIFWGDWCKDVGSGER